MRHSKSAIYIHKTWREAAAAVFTEGNISKTLASAVVPSENGFRLIHDKKNGFKNVFATGRKDRRRQRRERGEREGAKCAQVSDSETVMGID